MFSVAFSSSVSTQVDVIHRNVRTVTFVSMYKYRKENSLGYEYICYSLDTTLYGKQSYTDTL